MKPIKILIRIFLLEIIIFNSSVADEYIKKVNGNFKECQVFSMRYRYSVEMNYVLVEQIKFDDSGNKIEENSLTRDSTIDYQKLHKYDSNGYEIEIYDWSYNKNENPKLFYTILNHYDRNNRLIHEIFSGVSHYWNSKYSYRLDSNGKVKIRLGYDFDGSTNSKNLYTYNQAGKILIDSELNTSGDLSTIRRYKYNDKNLLVEKIERSSIDSTISRYDEHERLVEEVKYAKEILNKIHKLKIQYDNFGNIVEMTWYGTDYKNTPFKKLKFVYK